MFYRILFVLFLLSFSFDYKDFKGAFGAAQGGGSFFQFLFLAVAVASGGLATMIGLRHLLVRPGVFISFFWWAYVVFTLAVAFLSGNETGHIMRLIIPPLLVGFGINVTLIAAATGMRPGEAMRWFVLVALISCLWRFIYGISFSGLPISEVRMDILSPAIGFIFAWTGCALLLRTKFTWWTTVIFGIPMFVAAISVTRSLAFPLVTSFMMGSFCLGLGIVWKMYNYTFPLKKMAPLVVMAGAGTLVLLSTIAIQSSLLDSWNERLFHNQGVNTATTEDLSTLMRKAEAVSMLNILKEDPYDFIYGKGLGAAYYWDESYFPELFLVYPADRHQFPDYIYSAGHSIWTYTLFSRGFIGILFMLGAFFGVMTLSLHSAWLNSRTVMGPRAWDSFLMFYPFIAMWSVLSESITRNPFDERFTGVLFGFVAAFPQFFYNRAYYLNYRESVGQETAQIIVDESILDEAGEDVLIENNHPQTQVQAI